MLTEGVPFARWLACSLERGGSEHPLSILRSPVTARRVYTLSPAETWGRMTQSLHYPSSFHNHSSALAMPPGLGTPSGYVSFVSDHGCVSGFGV